MKRTLLRAWLAGGWLAWSLSTALAQDPAAEADYSSELPRIKALSVEEAMQSFQVQPGFHVELVAAEPLVKSPVAVAFNADGYLFAVEMRDYSEQETEHLGSIARLEDVDHDGRMDKRTTFVEGLSWPTALWPWKNGVLVAEPPNLIWFGDKDGDGVSDERQVWYEGFGRGNVQGLVNSLRWSVDGYIQGATSSSGAELVGGQETSDAGKKIALNGRDFSIDPLQKSLLPASGGGQHGMAFNRWGDKFVTSNSDHLQQIVDLDRWLSAHPGSVPVPPLRRSIAEDGPQAEVYRASPVEPWRIVRTRLRMSGAVPGIVEGGGRAAGYFTGATATWIMDKEVGYGDAEYDTAIVCDVGSNLVHRKRLLPQGLFWSGQRIDKESELFRSSDIWFRPVQLGDGPDGALYVVDMNREVIEHPKSLPPVIKKHLDLTSGRDRGRIWRLVPDKSSVVTAAKDTRLPGKLSSAELIGLLDSPIAWQRRTASQLLVERGDKSVHAALASQATTGKLPEGRVLALHVLNRLGLLDVKVLKPALADQHPRVLQHAITLVSTPELAAELSTALAAVASDDAHVQLSLAQVANLLPLKHKIAVLTKVLNSNQEPLTRAVALLSAGNDSPQLFADSMLEKPSGDLLRQVVPAWSSGLSQAGNDALRQQLTKLITAKLGSEPVTRDAWIGALVSLSSRAQADALINLLDDKAQQDLLVYVRDEVKKTCETKCVGRLGWSRLLPTEEIVSLAEETVDPTKAEPQQLAVVEALLWHDADAAVKVVIPQLPRMTPDLKRQVLVAVMRYSQVLPAIAEAIETKQVSRAEIAPEVRQQLFALPNKTLAERFKGILTAASADRAKVIEKYRGALQSVAELTDDQLASGQMVFKKVCAQCHRLQEEGNDVGPPLKQLADKSPDQLLDIILDPNREVDPKYLSYTVLLNDSRVLTGIIREASAGQIVLAETGGKLHTIPRTELSEMKTTGLSLMPNGLEEQIAPEQMAQLIGYLKRAATAK